MNCLVAGMAQMSEHLVDSRTALLQWLSLALSPAVTTRLWDLGYKSSPLELWVSPSGGWCKQSTYGAVGRSKETLCAGASKCPLFVIIIQLVYGLALPPRFVTLLVGSVFPWRCFQSSSPKTVSTASEGLEAVFLAVFLARILSGSFAAVLRFVLSICLRGIVANPAFIAKVVAPILGCNQIAQTSLILAGI